MSIVLSHWPCFTCKLFIIWFHKNLKLMLQKPPSSPRNICIEYWRKLPNLTAFLEFLLYRKNNDYVQHVQNALIIVLFINFQVKQTFHTTFDRSGCFEILFWFSSAILISKMKLLSFSMRKFAKFLIPFLKEQVSVSSNFASIVSAIKHNSSVLF